MGAQEDPKDEEEKESKEIKERTIKKEWISIIVINYKLNYYRVLNYKSKFYQLFFTPQSV